MNAAVSSVASPAFFPAKDRWHPAWPTSTSLAGPNEHIREILDRRFSPHLFSSEFIQFILAKTEGYPLFVEDQWRLARELSMCPRSIKNWIKLK